MVRKLVQVMLSLEESRFYRGKDVAIDAERCRERSLEITRSAINAFGCSCEDK